MSDVDATVHLIIEGKRWGYKNEIQSARVVASRTGKPAKLGKDQVAVKVTVRIPTSVFDPLQPEAVVIVPEGSALRGPIETVALDPGHPQGVSVIFDPETNSYSITHPEHEGDRP